METTNQSDRNHQDHLDNEEAARLMMMAFADHGPDREWRMREAFDIASRVVGIDR